MKRFSIVVLLGLIAAISLSAAQKSKPEKSKPRINEIDLEGRQGTRGNELFGPGFKITLRRDGTALFTGKAKVKLIGDFQGTITGAEFEQLVSFMVARNYDRIPEDPVNHSEITPPAGSARFTLYSDEPYMITRVVYEGGQTKTMVRPTTARGIDLVHIPQELFQIEQAVFDAATRIDWAKRK